MTAATETAKSHWDLSGILDFVNTLAPGNDDAVTEYQHSPLGVQPAHTSSNDDSALGDFSKVWQFLGNPDFATKLPPALTKEDYASDGATYNHSAHPKDVPSVGTDGEDLTASASDTPVLTKTQRKKLRRKERKAAREAERIQQATVSESEADFADKQTPARKASAHVVQTKPTALQAASDVLRRIKVAKKQESSQQARDSSNSDDKILDSEAVRAVAQASVALKLLEGSPPSTPASKARNARYDLRSNPAVQLTPSSLPPLSNRKYSVTNMSAHPIHAQNNSSPVQPIPSNGKPVSSIAVQPIAKTVPTWNRLDPNNSKGTTPQPVIKPAIIRSGEDREWALLLKIMQNFEEDRKYLVSPMNMTTHNNDPKGIHVFVDASNIFIGFMDQLKRSRNIHPMAKVPEVELSFDALALLIERRRPVAKRVLAGSTPHLSAFDKAKAVGYECSILEKVYKARELTERQIYFKELDRKRMSKRAPACNTVKMSSIPSVSHHGDISEVGSGSETNTPQYARPKMIEQGVDEILHLKILESVVDSETPSTIVLATGDAAAAEYSDGFMAMVVRALKKKWKVELVSWSKNISGMYKQPRWTNAWGDQFRIVYLDDFAEELLNM